MKALHSHRKDNWTWNLQCEIPVTTKKIKSYQQNTNFGCKKLLFGAFHIQLLSISYSEFDFFLFYKWLCFKHDKKNLEFIVPKLRVSGRRHENNHLQGLASVKLNFPVQDFLDDSSSDEIFERKVIICESSNQYESLN